MNTRRFLVPVLYVLLATPACSSHDDPEPKPEWHPPVVEQGELEPQRKPLSPKDAADCYNGCMDAFDWSSGSHHFCHKSCL